MKLILESTSKVVEIRAAGSSSTIPARIWQGHTEDGIPVHVYITRVAAPLDADQGKFQRDLEEHAAPLPDVAAIPWRLVI